MDGAKVVLFFQTVHTLQKRSVTYIHTSFPFIPPDMITALHDFTSLADLNDILTFGSILPSIHTV